MSGLVHNLHQHPALTTLFRSIYIVYVYLNVWVTFYSDLLVHEAIRNKCIATSNKCLTSSNKKLLGTSN